MTKRIFAAVIAIAMVCTMFAFASSAETTTVTLDSSVTAYNWDQILNAINFNDYDHNEDGWKDVAEATNVRSMLLYGLVDCGWETTSSNYNDILYTFDVNKLIDAGMSWIGDRPAAGTRFCDYFQNTFGAVAYALRGGKQKAVDLWNSYVPAQPIALLGDNAYTVTVNTLYTTESYDAALNALGAYMTYAQDNQVCNVGTAGRWTAQKARYAALETALQGLVEGAPTTPETPPEAPTETTVTLAAGSNYSWYGYLNALNVIPDTESEGLRADGTPYKVFLTELLAIMNGNGAASDAAYMNSYAMSDGTLLKDYAQDTYGAYAYVLRGGRQKAADYWNSKLSVGITLGNNSYTYTNASSQTAYDATAYQAAVDALVAYMANTADASCFDVENGGGRFFDQRSKYEALVAAVDACAATAVQTLVDMTGLTSPDYVTQLLITFYNNVDVESYRAKEVVQTWAAALKEGVEAGLAYDAILVGDVDVCTLWESTIRYEVLLNMGARTAADAVMNDASLWPLGAVIIDQAQTTYKAAQYQEVYDLWVQIRDEYKASTTVKTSEVIAACDTLKAKIQALEVASLPFTSEQKQAAMAIFDKNSSAYGPAINMSALEIYQQRLNRVVLDVNKATDTYINFKALIDTAAAWATLDWENGTSESYPTLEEIRALLTFDADGWIVGGSLEDDWYPFRLAFGLDNAGYDAVIAAAVAEWEASGLYTDASIAAVKESVANYEVSTMTGARGSSNTDEQTQGDIEIYKSMLEARPLPTTTLTIRGANVTLQESISLFFAIGDVSEYTDVYMEFSVNGVVTKVTESLVKGGMTCYMYPGISAKQGGDIVTATLCGTYEGVEYRSSAFVYSVADYCYSRLAKSTDNNFKKVCVDLLNYCSAAQVYFNYNTDNLANARLTEEQKALGSSSYQTLTDNSFKSEYTDYGIKAFNLLYEDVIKVMIAVDAPATEGLVAKVSFDGITYTLNEYYEQVIAGQVYYIFDFTKIAPTQFRNTFAVTFEVNGVVVGGTGTYSVESYLSRMIPKTTNEAYKALLEATAMYGDSCAAYFG